MPYVKRTVGVISCVFACAQPGFAEEHLQDDDPELLAFLHPVQPPPTKAQQIEAIIRAAGSDATRLTIHLTIQLSELTATVQAPAYSMTIAQAIAYAYSRNPAYKRAKDAEAEIRVLELAP